MSSLQNLLQQKSGQVFRFAAGFITAVVLVAVTLVGSAQAIGAPQSDVYVAPDGVDLTEIADCIPEQLSEGDLNRALDESTNEFLEKVFNLKDSYGEYELNEAEAEFLKCLERKGITPQVKQSAT